MTEGSEGPGEVLRAERESLGVTTRDVAETLNLSISMVEAIEADDYERMPAAVFARGYIRAYARLLDLEPEPIVARYPESGVGTDVHERVAPPGLRERLRRHPQVVVGGLVLVALLLLLALGFLLWPAEDAPAPRSSETGAVMEENQAAGGDSGALDVDDSLGREPLAGALERVAPSQPGADGPPGAAADVGLEPAGTLAAGVAEQVLGTPDGGAFAAGASDAGQGALRITEVGDDLLHFDFSQDCWVEVKTATGRNLYSNLGQAGSSLSLVGEGPFRILLGYAPGASIAFNGEEIPLAPHTRNNVATLVLGQ